jgi:hypothetical protein
MAGSHVTPTTQVAILQGRQFGILGIGATHTTMCSTLATDHDWPQARLSQEVYAYTPHL